MKKLSWLVTRYRDIKILFDIGFEGESLDGAIYGVEDELIYGDFQYMPSSLKEETRKLLDASTPYPRDLMAPISYIIWQYTGERI